MRKMALLSNVNMDPVVSALGNSAVKADGYGSVFEELLRPDSSVYREGAEHVYLLMDVAELFLNCKSRKETEDETSRWFEVLEGCLKPEVTYFVSDADVRYGWLCLPPQMPSVQEMEEVWCRRLRECSAKYANVHIFPLKKIMEQLGRENAYTDKMWYLARIPFGASAREAIVREIEHCEKMLETPKKVLLLDLDNTLWGGVIGEGSGSEIQLGDEKSGLIYKNLQRVIRSMKECGVVLGIVSKNNPEDALKVIKEHPHMMLREEDFAIYKINWEPKDKNIREIAAQLNLGTDSIVFFDDNPAERALVQESLPEVTVPDFPAQTERLPAVMMQIFHDYFEKWVYTKEDAEKTEQYRANAKRKELEGQQTDYAGFLKSLDIRIKRVDALENRERLLQLLNKTNQFNLTTTRYTEAELEQILADKDSYEVYLFEVSDRFGNNGITAAVIVRYGEKAEIESFVLSCRIMGRMIENMVLDYVENDAWYRGYRELFGRYVYTPKSKPVERFYDGRDFLVLRQDENGKDYETILVEYKPQQWYGKLEVGSYEKADRVFLTKMAAYADRIGEAARKKKEKEQSEND